MNADFVMSMDNGMALMEVARNRRPYPVADRSGILKGLSGGFPLFARPWAALETVPLLGAQGTVGRPAPAQRAAGLGQPSAQPAAIVPNTAPAAPLTPSPLEFKMPFMPILGLVTAAAAVAYMALR